MDCLHCRFGGITTGCAFRAGSRNKYLQLMSVFSNQVAKVIRPNLDLGP